MGFGEAISTCLRKFVTFSGRARRSEYWYFYLFTILAGIPASVADALISAGAGQKLQIFQFLVSIALFLPSLAVTVRRLHDTGRSGWLFLGFFAYFIVGLVVLIAMLAGSAAGGKPNFTGATIPVLAMFGLGALAYAIYIFVLLVLNGNAGPNTYGADPKGPDVAVFS